MRYEHVLSFATDHKGTQAMRKGTSTLVATLAAVLALTVTGCGSDPASSAETDEITLGMSVSTLGNPFFVEMKKGAEQEAKAHKVTLSVSDARDDANQQANHLQDFTSRGVTAIIVNPVDSDAAGPSVKAAVNAGVPVVAADRAVNGAPVATTVASDNVEGGKLAADVLAEELDGKGTIVVLRGTAGTSASQERGKGFTEGLKKHPGITVVATQTADFDRARGMDVMTNLLQRHPDIDGVFAENDEMALGAVKALGDRAGSSVTVVGFDGTADGLKAVKSGTLAASIAQQPDELGRMAVRNAVRLARGSEVDKEIKVPVKVVTKDNVDQFL